MNDLIKVEVHGDGVQTCNARDLHAFLEVGRDFTSWIKARIEKYQFVDGEDFTTSTDLRSPNRGNSKARVQEIAVYHISLDMAKELSMVENNEKGKEARKYFITKEKELRELKSIPDFNNPAVAARAWADEYDRRIEAETDRRQLQAKAIRDQPKVEFYDTVVASDGALSMEETAKLLGVMGRNTLFKYLRERKVLTRQNLPMARFMDVGWFNVVESSYTIDYGTHINKTTRVYQKGLDGIRRAMKKDGLIPKETI